MGLMALKEKEEIDISLSLQNRRYEEVICKLERKLLEYSNHVSSLTSNFQPQAVKRITGLSQWCFAMAA